MQHHLTCRGRNGWFQMAEHEVLTKPDIARINIKSRKQAKESPIVLIGHRKTMVNFLKEIIDQLEAQTC